MISIVVPWRTDNGRREEIWRWCFARWALLMPDFGESAELIERDSKQEVFSRSEALNRALRRASGDPIIIADADHVVDERWLHESLDIVRNEPCWCVPLRHQFMEQGPSDRVLAGWAGIPYADLPPLTEDDVEWEGITGNSGLLVVSRAAIEATHGFDARFDGWGLQDAAFAMAVTTLGWTRVKRHSCLHLWHPHNQAEPGGIGQSFGNVELIRRYEKAIDYPDVMAELVAEPGHDL